MLYTCLYLICEKESNSITIKFKNIWKNVVDIKNNYFHNEIQIYVVQYKCKVVTSRDYITG